MSYKCDGGFNVHMSDNITFFAKHVQFQAFSLPTGNFSSGLCLVGHICDCDKFRLALYHVVKPNKEDKQGLVEQNI